jgi:hypothetical protein
MVCSGTALFYLGCKGNKATRKRKKLCNERLFYLLYQWMNKCSLQHTGGWTTKPTGYKSFIEKCQAMTDLDSSFSVVLTGNAVAPVVHLYLLTLWLALHVTGDCLFSHSLQGTIIRFLHWSVWLAPVWSSALTFTSWWVHSSCPHL